MDLARQERAETNKNIHCHPDCRVNAAAVKFRVDKWLKIKLDTAPFDNVLWGFGFIPEVKLWDKYI